MAPPSQPKGVKASGHLLMHGGMFSGQRPKLHLPSAPDCSSQVAPTVEVQDEDDEEGFAYDNPESGCDIGKPCRLVGEGFIFLLESCKNCIRTVCRLPSKRNKESTESKSLGAYSRLSQSNTPAMSLQPSSNASKAGHTPKFTL